MIGKKTDRLAKFQITSYMSRAQLFHLKFSAWSRPEQTPVRHIFTQRHSAGHKHKLSHGEEADLSALGRFPLYASLRTVPFLSVAVGTVRGGQGPFYKLESVTRYACPLSN